MTTTAGYSSWEVATAGANGSTSQGYVEQHSQVGGADGSVALNNNKVQLEQIQYLLMDQRRRDAQLRREIRTALNIAPGAPVKVMVCGDSITMGLGSSDAWGYPGWMVDLLDRQNIPLTLSYNAHGGWELTNIMQGMAAALSANTPDVVTIHIGTNDAGNTYALAAFQANLTSVLKQILAFSPAVRGVVCALIPTSQGVTATYQQGEQTVNGYVQNAVTALADPRVVIADCTATTEACWNRDDHWPGAASPPGRWTLEGMHPLDAACIKMAEQLLAAAQQWIPGYAPAQ